MESITSHIGVVVVAGGSGSRMGGNLPKQFMLLDGQPILARTINNFAEALPGAEIVVVLPADYIDFWQDYARRFDVAEHRTTAGGAERFHSVANGIAALSDACDLIAVQDGVRPLATHEAIRRIARTAEREGSAIPVVQPVDSFRIVTAEGASHPVERADAAHRPGLPSSSAPNCSARPMPAPTIPPSPTTRRSSKPQAAFCGSSKARRRT